MGVWRKRGTMTGTGEADRARGKSWPVLFVLTVLSGMALAQSPVTEWPDSREVWLASEKADDAAPVYLRVSEQRIANPGETLDVSCVLHSEKPHKRVPVTLRLFNPAQAEALNATLTLDLVSGETPCIFGVALAKLPQGSYSGRVEAIYRGKSHPAVASFTLEVVGPVWMRERFAALQKEVDELQSRLSRKGGPASASPAIPLHLAVARLVLQSVPAEGQAGHWSRLDEKLRHVEQTLARVRPALLFGAMPRDWVGDPVAQDAKGTLTQRDGGLLLDNRPAFLIGAALDTWNPEALSALGPLGFRFAALAVGADALLGAQGEGDAAFVQRLDQTLDAAANNGISVAVQLYPERMGAWTGPDTGNAAEAHIAHPAVRESFARSVALLAPRLAQHANAAGLSLASNPRFRFDDEETRKAFIERVRAQYPECQELNRIWHAHLSKYDDITIWDTVPDTAFQSRPTYQFDWQTFHHELMAKVVDEAEACARGAADKLPLMVTVPDTLFLRGETRTTLPREALFKHMDAVAGSTATPPNAAGYGLGYPQGPAYMAYLKSIAPDKPVLDMAHALPADQDMDGSACGRYVRTALFETALAGASAIAVPAASPVWSNPWGLDALVFAQHDLNRVAPVICAFQQAPCDIAILFSNASKLLNDGEAHLKSALAAFEGCSFSGYAVRFVTEEQIAAGALARVRLLVIPETAALPDKVFDTINQFAAGGGVLVRIGTPVPYDEHGKARLNVLLPSSRNILVRGKTEPVEYLHAIDVAISRKALPPIRRAVTANGYPIEGLRTRNVEWNDASYVYLANLRDKPVSCTLTGELKTGRDLLAGKDVQFPMELPPLTPMLVRLEKHVETLPKAELQPAAPQKQ